MVTFGVIGFLVLILIYFVLRSQNLQKELKQYQHQLKTTDNQSKFTLQSMGAISRELQKSYVAKLTVNKRSALISEEDFEVANAILTKFDYVVMQCCERNATIEEAVNRSLEGGSLDIEQLKQFIAKQQKEIKVPWCQNSIAGYITACHNISGLGSRSKTNSENSETETQN